MKYTLVINVKTAHLHICFAYISHPINNIAAKCETKT